MVLSRQALKFVVLRKVGADDFLIFLAAVRYGKHKLSVKC
jgi:hypothetical protein